LPTTCAVLVSGTGTILDAMLQSGIDVAIVVADRPCAGLAVAEAAGVATALLDRANYGGFTPTFDRAAFSRALAAILRDAQVDVVAMAGFGTVVTADLHAAFAGRVLNTHPSLLPDFKGWHAVAQALASGALETGCTVHVATEALDDGPILAQRRVAILEDDDEQSLHERIKRVERTLYPAVLARVLAGLAEGIEPADLDRRDDEC
jgi:phosphoribosylglycinamide formyltransferase-1